MTGVICGQCFKASTDARHPVCERTDCPGAVRFKPPSAEAVAAAHQRLQERIAERDRERGRPLTDRERLNNLHRAIYGDE